MMTHTNAPTQPNIVKDNTKTSPVFDEAIDPIQLLEKLDTFIETLEGKPDTEAITHIQKELNEWQIIVLNSDNKHLWITEPFKLHNVTRRRSMTQRVMHLVKTGGEWKNEFSYQDTVEVTSRTSVPLTININSETRNKILDDSLSVLLVTLVNIHSIIMTMLENGSATVGVFRKPSAVVAMNKLRAWLSENETHGSWTMKYNLEVMSMYDVANTATFSIPMSHT